MDLFTDWWLVILDTTTDGEGDNMSRAGNGSFVQVAIVI